MTSPIARRSSAGRLAGLALAVALPLALAAAEPKPAYTTKEIMKALHKGEDNTAKRVLQGRGTAEDLAALVKYYESLPLNEPPQGDKASWDEKSKAVLAAAKALKAGEAGAADRFKQAVNCKACHSVHKPE
jgi:hypothetical protein